MALTDTAIRAAKPIEGRTIKLSDGGGLQLWVAPSGSKRWNIAYRYGGKQLKLSLGAYPAVGLKEARAARRGQTAFGGRHPSRPTKKDCRPD